MEGIDENGLPLERFSPQHPLLVEMQPPGGVDVRQWVATDAAGAAGSRPPPGFGRPSTKKPPIKKQLTTAHQLKWLVIDRQGNTSVMTSYKNEITQQTGIQLRDLRLLDPKLATSYPSAILCRESALVVNLEYVKMVVTVDRAYVTNLEDEHARAYVDELCRRLAAEAAGAGAGAGLPPIPSEMEFDGGGADGMRGAGEPSLAGEQTPLELFVLEVALDLVSAHLERMAADLEAAAHPALDALTVGVSTSALERVRRIKTRLVRLTTRVETLREVLEKLLDDDDDLHDMNLTAKESERAQGMLRAASRSGIATPFDVPLPLRSGGLDGGAKSPATPRSVLSSRSGRSEEEEEAIEEVEMLLEPYFMQVDNTYNKLQTLNEYINDTEDFVNVELDSKRNQLIRVDLILTSLTASVAMVTAVTSLFAMNLELQPGIQGQGPWAWFVAVSVTSAVAAICIFCGVLLYARKKRLI